MQVRDVMTTQVACVQPQDTVQKAAQLMKDHDVGAVPVCSGSSLVGIVTDRDITLRCVAQGKDIRQAPVSDVMTANPVSVSADTDVQQAAQIMSSKQIRRLPIVENNSLVGMVSLGDLAVEPAATHKAGDALKNISEPAHHNQ